jgi:hypothetical protein
MILTAIFNLTGELAKRTRCYGCLSVANPA